MNKVLIGGILFCLQAFNYSYADNGWFVGGGGGLVSFDDEVDVVDTGNLYLRLGYSLGGFIDLGVDYSFTLLTDDISDVDHDLDIAFAYIKANIPINDSSKLYLMLGATQVKLSEGTGISSSSFEDNGSGFGVGVQIKSDQTSSYTAEYLIYYDDDEFDGVDIEVISSSFNLGFIRYF